MKITEMRNCIEQMRKCYNFDDDKTEIHFGDIINGSQRYVSLCTVDDNGTRIEMTKRADELVDIKLNN